jgi:NADPH-dependent stearoyl-CoA 9-desaturase
MAKTFLHGERLAAFQAELDQLRTSVMADLGEVDARYIRRVRKITQASAITGRSLLMFGIGPISWVGGIAALAHAKILENMELGHNILHGQYDWMNDPAFHSKHYSWDMVCAPENWKQSHNIEHHNYTNILGKDQDYGYGLFRLSSAQRWRPGDLMQPLSYLLLAANFQWGIAIQDLKLGRLFKGRMSLARLKQTAAPFMKKAGSQLFKDYVLFPALAFWQWPRVMLGNLIANGIRNVWTNAVIFCGHFTTHAQTFTLKETKDECRGRWYLRQIQGSSNLEGSRLLYIHTGHLSHQIEHHLFPDMPARRYPEIAPKVREICERYGIHYNTGGFWKQYASALWRITRYAFPSRKPAPATA